MKWSYLILNQENAPLAFPHRPNHLIIKPSNTQLPQNHQLFRPCSEFHCCLLSLLHQSRSRETFNNQMISIFTRLHRSTFIHLHHGRHDYDLGQWSFVTLVLLKWKKKFHSPTCDCMSNVALQLHLKLS